MSAPVAARLARNLQQLREARGLTQQQMAKLADMPRATWTHLESGEGNPTLPGAPHTPGTREYLTCERGRLALAVAGQRWELSPGDVVVFRGDQKHSYANVGEGPAVGYSVVTLAGALFCLLCED